MGRMADRLGDPLLDHWGARGYFLYACITATAIGTVYTMYGVIVEDYNDKSRLFLGFIRPWSSNLHAR